ncbi:response regulator transcription factor [Cellulomonas chitinilytica]|uniref:response regulator transcription factor n=1 Tax=Cellulomonas chitinilytica TaxID=398759 RepID=UPI0019445D08|nr:response regulator transcription factor [Cellulomonas chitinilytica]
MRIVLAEDSVILRDGLVALLARRGHDVVAVGDGDALVREVTQRGAGGLPDVVIADIRMPPTFTDEGMRAATALRAAHPTLPVLVFSQYVETRYATQLLAGGAGGVGYLLKDRVAEVRDFLDAVRRVASGQTVLDPEVVTQLMGSTSATADPGLGRLTPREREVLELMAEGRSNGAIADRLFLSYGAVEKNVAQIFTKLGLEADSADHRRVLAVLRYLGA